MIYSAVPVLRVANVARSAAWYAAVLGFTGDAEAFRARVQALVPDVGPIEDREYGCRELAMLDPDGHVVVLGECG